MVNVCWRSAEAAPWQAGFCDDEEDAEDARLLRSHSMRIVLNFRPRPLKRHRHTLSGHTYDPSAKDKQELLQMVTPFKPEQPMTGALRMRIVFTTMRPKKPKYSYPKTTGDVDNMAKLVLDALNKVFYEDDSQVTSLYCEKKYGNNHTTDITIEHDQRPTSTDSNMGRIKKRPRNSPHAA